MSRVATGWKKTQMLKVQKIKNRKNRAEKKRAEMQAAWKQREEKRKYRKPDAIPQSNPKTETQKSTMKKTKIQHLNQTKQVLKQSKQAINSIKE